MKVTNAIKAMSALAHETRLKVFRLLVQRGPHGLPAGEIARALRVPPPTLSFHLRHLEQAGLLRSRRQQRQMIYVADYQGMGNLLSFLTEDCCQSDPAICEPAFQSLSCSTASLMEANP